MSSKENLAAADSKKKKKDKPKKEKKDKKEKKEKKEKSSKTDGKETDKSESVDNLEVNKSQGPEGSPSSKPKRFGMFRLSGKKSKGDKKSSKQGSRESLKKEGESSPDSVRYEKRESSASLEESTSSNEPANVSVETCLENDTQLQNIDEGVRNADTELDNRGEQSKETKEDEAVIEANEPQLDFPKKEDASNNAQEESAAKQEEPDHSIEVTPLHEEDVVYRLETSKNEQFEEECANIEEQSPAPVSQIFEFEQHPSVIPNNGKEESKETADSMAANQKGAKILTEDQEISGRNFARERRDVISLEDVNKEQEKEVTSSEGSSVDTVISAEYANAEVFNDNLEAAKAIDKVLAAENETVEDSKQNNVVFDENATDAAEEAITATYKETKRSGLEETDKREVPEEAIVFEYTGKKEETTTEKTTEELQVVEQPIVVTERKIEPLQEEITPVQDETGPGKEEVKAEQGTTFKGEQPIVLTESRTVALQEESTPVLHQPEVAIVTSEERKAGELGNASVEGKPTMLTETKTDALQQSTPPIQNESDMLTSSERGENKAEPAGTSVEEPVKPTYKQRTEPETEVQHSAGDTSVNEDTMVLSYPENDEKENPKQAEPQVEEAPVVHTYSEKQQESINLLQEDHHLIAEDENTVQRDKDEKVEEDKEENSKKEIREKERSLAEVKVESPFISQELVQSSTPKYRNEGEIKEDHATFKAEVVEKKPLRGQRVPTEYKVRSVVEHYNSMVIVSSIRAAKMSNNRLLNQLIEENKKLRALQLALRELLKIKTSDTLHVLEQEE